MLRHARTKATVMPYALTRCKWGSLAAFPFPFSQNIAERQCSCAPWRLSFCALGLVRSRGRIRATPSGVGRLWSMGRQREGLAVARRRDGCSATPKTCSTPRWRSRACCLSFLQRRGNPSTRSASTSNATSAGPSCKCACKMRVKRRPSFTRPRARGRAERRCTMGARTLSMFGSPLSVLFLTKGRCGASRA